MCLPVLALGAALQPAPGAASPDRPLAHWPCDAGAGDILRDAGPRHLDGRIVGPIVGPAWCDLGPRKALRFDGAGGAFMDGFLWACGGRCTCDRRDGHSADIDPATRTIARRKGSALLRSQPALVAFAERLRARGGVEIANNVAMTRTMGRLPVITDREITEGPDGHPAQTPVTMGNPAAIRTETDVYADVLRKLAWGNLYFYYGEGTLNCPSLPQQMYPITVEEIRAGLVIGRERLVTLRTGAYGWPGDRSLHQAWRCDARGCPVPHTSLTTADPAGVRTRLELGPDESAALRRLPVTLESAAPVNARVGRFDADGLALRLNGAGQATLRVAADAFGPVAGAVAAAGDGVFRLTSVAGSLPLSLALAGPVAVRVIPERQQLAAGLTPPAHTRPGTRAGTRPSGLPSGSRG